MKNKTETWGVYAIHTIDNHNTDLLDLCFTRADARNLSIKYTKKYPDDIKRGFKFVPMKVKPSDYLQFKYGNRAGHFALNMLDHMWNEGAVSNAFDFTIVSFDFNLFEEIFKEKGLM